MICTLQEKRGTGRDNSEMGATEGGMSYLSFSVPISTDIQELYLIVTAFKIY
jgi:hypothetical protein